MSVYKMVEVVGTSGTSVSDAIRGAVERATSTLEDVQWFEVKEIRGRVKENEVAEYQVRLGISFLLHAPEKPMQKPVKQGATRQTRSARAQVAAKRGERGRSDVAKGFERQPSGSRSR